VVKASSGAKILGTTTVCDYKKDSGYSRKEMYICAYEGNQRKSLRISKPKKLISRNLACTLLSDSYSEGKRSWGLDCHRC
jgi:hypothetical protein